MFPPCIDLSPSTSIKFWGAPPCSQHLCETLPPVLYPDIFSYCWIGISNNYVKQVVLINHSRISPTLQKGWESEFHLFFKKWGRVHFSLKKGEVGKIVEEWRLLRENNLCLLTNLCVYKSKKHYNPRNIYESNKFYYIPTFLR